MAARLLESLWVTGYGASAASGFVFFYQPGTLTPVSVYSNDAASTVVTQPVRLDANGRTSAPLYLKAPARCIIQNSGGATLVDIERIDGDRAELVALANPSWPSSTSENAAWTALATSLGGTDGNFKAAGTGSIARSIQSKVSEAISVKDFGAKGDGVTDDTGAFVSAIAYATSIGGATIRVPAGTYLVASTLAIAASNIQLSGDGQTASIIKNTSSTGIAISLSAVANVSFTDLSIANSATSTAAAISITGASSIISLTRCTITGHRIGISQPSGTLPTGVVFSGGLSLVGCSITCDGNAAASAVNAVNAVVSGFITTLSVGGGSAAVVSVTAGAVVLYSCSLLGGVGVSTTSASAWLYGNRSNGAIYSTSTGAAIISGMSSGTLPLAQIPGVAFLNPDQGSWGDTGPVKTQSIGTTSAYVPDNTKYRCHRVIGTAAGITITISNPSTVQPSGGSRFSILFTNTSGGAVTWAFGATYRVAAVAPATGFGIGVTFVYDPTQDQWYEESRGSAAPAP